jgi:hypothetical protein
MLCFKLPPAPFFDLSIPGVLGFISSLFLVWRVFRATKKSRSEP